jgi:hypothetical protein
MKLESVIQRFYGRNTGLSIIRAYNNIDTVMKNKADILRKHGGRNFCRALNNIMNILKKLNEQKLSPDSLLYESFYEFFHSMISKIYDYLTVNPDITAIETALININSEDIIRLKRELDHINLKMRTSLNSLSESFEDQYVCIRNIKTRIQQYQQVQKRIENEQVKRNYSNSTEARKNATYSQKR